MMSLLFGLICIPFLMHQRFIIEVALLTSSKLFHQQAMSSANADDRIFHSQIGLKDHWGKC